MGNDTNALREGEGKRNQGAGKPVEEDQGAGKPRPYPVRETEPPVVGPRVIVVGNLTIDDVVLPDGTTRMASMGGNSLYAALGVRLWQPRVGVVTRRGEDFPRDLSAELQALGVATDGIVDIAGPTVRNWIVYENNGDRHWLYRTPRERYRQVAVQPEDIPASWLTVEPPPVIHIAAVALEAAEALVERVRSVAPHAIITLDTHEAYVVDYRQRLRDLAARVDAFLPSRAELADLVGYDDPPRALATLTGLPTPAIVVKMGAEGALVWDKAQGTFFEVGIAPGPVVDVTGAGDAFCGGFAAGLSLGCSPLESAQRGAVSASYAVADFGSLRLTHPNAKGTDAMEPDAINRVPADIVGTRFIASAPIASASIASTSSISVPGADRGISSEIDAMREEIAMIPRLLAEQHERLAESLHALATRLSAEGIKHLYLSGCGDSAFAGAASALAFQKHAGIDAEGVHALELARYRVRYLPRHSAVVCISFSGKVGRTIEAAMQARRFGHRVVVVTGAADSPLAQQADDVLLLSVPTLGYSPGTSTYLAILAALLDLSVVWGKARGRDTFNAEMLLRQSPDLARRTLEDASAAVQSVAEQLVEQSWLTFLGGGPNLATAHFGAAKMFEGPQKLGVATNIEEWAHEEYFVSGADTPVFLIAPAGSSFDRATEILSELNFMGAYLVMISDTSPAQSRGTFIPLASGLPEEFSPLLAALPLSLFAFHLSRASGQQRFEFASPEIAREHYETIHRATQGEPA